LQETAEAQKAAVQRKRREADDRVPFVGFNGAIRDPQLDRRVSATNGAAADEMEITLVGLTQIDSDERCNGGIEDRFVCSGIEQAIVQPVAGRACDQNCKKG